MDTCVGVQSLSFGQLPDAATELALIDRCRRQDFDAFGRFMDAYQSRVYGFVRRMVSQTEDAADVTQEVFIRAFQNFHKFDGRSSVKTWLFRIAHNLCVDRSRRVGRTPSEASLSTSVESEDTWDVPDETWQPERIAMDAELEKELDVAIASMSEKLRSVLLLHDREDCGYEEIAEMLSIPVGTVKSRLFLARSHLQGCLGPYLRGTAARPTL